MIPTSVKRPRNVDWKRAAAILYGDWGTSKAYVIGLAFAVAGYASFWLIATMCVLTALVGLNYMVICRLYPDGGGVYASVRHRSEVISIVGAFLLIADYLVTAAISSLSAFAYLGVPHPEKFAAAAILIIGLLNILGPRHTGGLAFLISVPTAIVVVVLGLFSLPHMGQAIGHLQPLHGGFWQSWAGFVGIVLALSGVEAIANATGVMKLDPGSTDENPSVVKTSTPAILWVMIEVCIFTALLGLAMHALGGLQIVNGDVNAPGAEGVRDYMLRYMGEVFVGGALGHTFGFIISVVFGLLLLSAVNTAIVDLITIQFLMSRDREIPTIFQRLNKWGVPSFGMALATIVPMLLVLVVKDMSGLADLYAVGVVGAIATNLGATATDRKLSIKTWERTLMFVTFIVMAAIEMSLLIDKPNARYFAVTILAVGLILRGLVQERRMKKEAAPVIAPAPASVAAVYDRRTEAAPVSVGGEAMLCAIRGTGRTLDFALREASETGRRLYLLFVREQAFMTEQDAKRKWQDDPEASSIFAEAKQKAAAGVTPLFAYAVSPSAAETIVDIAATLGASRLILGAPRRHALINLLRGNVIREVSASLPEEIDLLVYA
jgi:amino acid transporter/nucleotide-binding universal stress UspA family protein